LKYCGDKNMFASILTRQCAAAKCEKILLKRVNRAYYSNHTTGEIDEQYCPLSGKGQIDAMRILFGSGSFLVVLARWLKRNQQTIKN
jgi:hypothetical protein